MLQKYFYLRWPDLPGTNLLLRSLEKLLFDRGQKKIAVPLKFRSNSRFIASNSSREAPVPIMCLSKLFSSQQMALMKRTIRKKSSHLSDLLIIRALWQGWKYTARYTLFSVQVVYVDSSIDSIIWRESQLP